MTGIAAAAVIVLAGLFAATPTPTPTPPSGPVTAPPLPGAAAPAAPLVFPSPHPILPAGLAVQVTRITPAGAVLPLAHHEVILEQWSRPPNPSSPRRLDTTWVGRTDAAGFVVFHGLTVPKQGSFEPSVIYQGTTFHGPSTRNLTSGSALPIRVYDVTNDRAPLRAAIEMGLSLRDGDVLIDQTVNLVTVGRQAIDLSREPSRGGHRGFRFPLPLPTAFGMAFTQGLLPAETSKHHFALSVQPRGGRWVVEDGALWYRGVVLPGEGMTLDVRYLLPIHHEREDLAFASPVKITDLVVTSLWSDRTAPRLIPQRPYQVVERQASETIQRFMRIDDPPKPGAPMIVRLDHLPRPFSVYDSVALLGGATLLALFLLAMIAGRPRELTGRREDG